MPSQRRPVAVLDADVLVPPALRDLLLSCADAAVFRPVWQAEIEHEVRRNMIRLAITRRGIPPQQAASQAEHTLIQMNRAFPDARLGTRRWRPLMASMTNHPKDRHVLAAAVAAGATGVVTNNLRDFPVASRPEGVMVSRADPFLLERLAQDPDAVVNAVQRMAARNRRPPNTVALLAEAFASGRQAPRFGHALISHIETG